MIWFVPAAVVVLVLVALAWWTSGRSTGPTPPGIDRARREGDVTRDYGPSNVPPNTGGV